MLGRQDAFHGMGGKIACLRHIGYLAGPDPAEGEKSGSEPMRRRGMPRCIWAQHMDPRLLDNIDDLIAES